MTAHRSRNSYVPIRRRKSRRRFFESLEGRRLLAAETLYWDPAHVASGTGSGGAGTWDATTPNWFDGTSDVEWGSVADPQAVFAGSAGTVTLASALSTAALGFNTTGYTITGADLSFYGATGTISVAAAASADLGTAITGGAGLDFSGPGTLTLSAANTYSGTTAVDGGTLEISGAVASPTIDVNDSAALDVVVVNTNDSGPGSLRQAITTTNETSGATPTIDFGIPGGGVQTIAPDSALPVITAPVVIDGYSQPGASANTLAVGDNAQVIVQLNGASAGGNADGLDIASSGVTVRGLDIDGFAGAGIAQEAGASGDTIEGNFIGALPTGVAPGVQTIDPVNNGFEEPNLGAYYTQTAPGWTFTGNAGIAGNGSTFGVVNADNGNSDGTTSSTGQAAYVGSNSSIYQTVSGFQGGTVTVTFAIEGSNSSYAQVDVYLDNIFLGAYVPASDTDFNSVTTRAVAATPASHRLQFSAPYQDTTIFIDDVSIANTQSAAANGQGVALVGGNTALGGTTADARNVISGNAQDGVALTGAATDDTIEGDYIGVDPTGAVGLGNGGSGVAVDASTNVIGGTITGAGNVISGNQDDGVVFPGATDDGNVVEGNQIGTNAAGTASLPNVNNGVEVEGANDAVGGTTAAARNIISGNTQNGVYLNGAGASGDTIEGNYIGTDVTGMAALPNGGDGVSLAGAGQNTIGGDVSGAGNLISGNANEGVYVDATSTDNTVAGNLIGTNASGAGRLIVNTLTGLALPAVPLPSGLVGWWTGDGNTGLGPGRPSDQSGHGNSATVVGTVGYTTGVYGSLPYSTVQSGEAFRFDGNDQNYVTVPDSASLELTQATIGAWIDLAAAPAEGLDYVIATKGTVGTTENYSLYITNAGVGDLEVAVETNNGTATRYVSTGAHLTVGEAFWVFATVDGTTVSFYVNGALVSQTPQTAALTTNNGPLQIGSGLPGASNSFDGSIGYLQIYDRALSADEIAGMFADTSNLRGIELDGADNIIGGTTAAARNVIAGNAGDGILILGSAASGNIVEGDYIGTDITGGTALSNGLFPHSTDASPYGGNGIEIAGASNNTIGGTTPAARNIISGNAGLQGNSGNGIATRRFSGQAAPADNTIEGNYIGTDPTGTIAVPNITGVSLADGSNNVVGGIVAGARNIVSGNQGGIAVGADHGDVVEGNYVGTDPTGTMALPNYTGIDLNNGDQDIIGGTVAGARNIVSGNTAGGIGGANWGSNITVEGNYIGTDVSGENALGNGGPGVLVGGVAQGTVVGGTTLSDRNVISANGFMGVQISGASDVVVEGNYIGTNASGTEGMGNNYDGIYIQNNGSPAAIDNVIGGSTPGAGNVIAGSTYGIYITSSSSNDTVQGNYIGTNAARASLGNTTGVYIAGASNVVGGAAAGDGNTIANNGEAVVLAGNTATGNAIRGNSIIDNGFGIDLGGKPLVNDSLGHVGPNDFQDFPLITSVLGGYATQISGTFDEAAEPNTALTLDFYLNSAADPTGYGQGATYLGSTSVTTDPTGAASFTATFAAATALGQFVTATATDPSGNTSEFSADAPVTEEPPTITSAATTLFIAGEDGTFTATTSGFPIAALTESGALPVGVTFVDNGDGTATLAGTPDADTGGLYDITIKADNGNAPAATQSFVLIDAVTPVVSATPNLTTVVPGQDETLTLNVQDSLASDQAAGFKYTIDWGDGTTQTIGPAPSGMQVSHIYQVDGNYTATITAASEYSIVSQPIMQNVHVVTLAVQGNNLAVGDTAPGDTFSFGPDTSPLGNVVVSLNGNSLGTFAIDGKILAFGPGSGDTFNVSPAGTGENLGTLTDNFETLFHAVENLPSGLGTLGSELLQTAGNLFVDLSGIPINLGGCSLDIGGGMGGFSLDFGGGSGGFSFHFGGGSGGFSFDFGGGSGGFSFGFGGGWGGLSFSFDGVSIGLGGLSLDALESFIGAAVFDLLETTAFGLLDTAAIGLLGTGAFGLLDVAFVGVLGAAAGDLLGTAAIDLFETAAADLLGSSGIDLPGGLTGALGSELITAGLDLGEGNLAGVVGTIDSFITTAVGEATTAGSGVTLDPALVAGAAELRMLVGAVPASTPAQMQLEAQALDALAAAIPGGLTGGNALVGPFSTAAIDLAEGSPLGTQAALDSFIGTAVSEAATAGSGVDMTTMATLVSRAGTLLSLIGASDAGLTAGALTPPVATEGQAFANQTVFHFSDADPTATAGDFTAVVAPGDGTTIELTSKPSANGQIVANTAGGFDVQLSYTYADKLSDQPFNVVVVDAGSAMIGANTNAFSAADAALSITSVTHPSAAEGISTGTVTLASFTDAAGASSNINDLSAAITWADGSISTGTVVATGTPGSYLVTGSHTYAEELSTPSNFTVAVSDIGGASASSTIGTATVSDAPLTGNNTAIAGGTEGKTLSSVLSDAVFTDANPGDHSGDMTATITWGDKTANSLGTVSYNSTSGVYMVSGSHTYAEEGAWPISIVVNDVGGSTTTITGDANVADAPLTAGTASATAGTEGVPACTLTATFSDANTAAPTTDFSGTIDWGDGTSASPDLTFFTSSAVTRSGSNYTVSGSHLYAEGGTYPLSIVVDDVGGSTTTITGSVHVVATPVITWVKPADITYGTPLGPTQLDATANIAGSFTYTLADGATPASDAIVHAGQDQTLNVTFTPTDSADYTIPTAQVEINVDQATPTVAANGVSISYGTALANAQLGGAATWTVNGQQVSVPGTFAYTSATGTVLHPGNSESETVTFMPSDSTDYANATGTVSVDVGQATPTIATNDVSITYGTALANGGLSGTAMWAVDGQQVIVPGTFAFTSAAGTVLRPGNNQSETVTFMPRDSTDYANATGTVSVGVSQAAPIIATNDVSITYGTPLANSQLSGTATWTVNGQQVSVPGTFAYTSAAGTVLHAGKNQIEAVTFTPSDTTDYASATGTASVDVGQATLTIAANGVNITYGTPLANGQLSGTATWTVEGQQVSVPGTFAFTSAAGTVLHAGNNQSEAVTFTPSDATDYANATGTVSVDVGQATPTIAANGVSITYGAALANAQLGGTATWTVNGQQVSVPGTFAYTSAAGTVLHPGNNQSETVTFMPSDSTDYTNATGTVSVDVGLATPTIAANGVSITYGAALANAQLGGTATWTVNGQQVSLPGTFAYTSAAGTVLHAGNNQSETVTFMPSDSTDYANATGTVSVDVGQATPTIAANGVSITYGTPLANGQLSGTATWTVDGQQVSVPGTFAFTSAAGTVLHAGNNQSETVTFTPSDTTDYTDTTATMGIDVSQATPTIGTNDVSITYGTALANGELSGTAMWTVDGQQVSVPGTFAFTPAAGTVLHAGNNQSATVTFTPTDSTDYANATGTASVDVGQATPTIAAHGVSITYGTPLTNGQLSGTATWTVDGQQVSVPGTFAYSSAAGTVLHAGNNQSEAVTFTPSDTTDYADTTGTASVDVGQATLTIAANGVSITYGTALANGQLSGTATWTVDGQQLSVPGTFAFTSAAGTVLHAGNNQSETVTFTPTDSTDYANATGTASVDVGQATPTIAANGVSLTYGTPLANGQVSGTATWTVNGQQVSVPGTFAYSSAAGTVLHAGNNQSEAVNFTPSDSTDYADAAGTASIDVGQATPAIAANSVSITYGTALANGQLSGTATWTVDGQQVNVPGTFAYASADGTVLHGRNNQSEAVTFTPSDTTDYATETAHVDINVDPAPLTITADNKSMTYGGTLPALTASYAGLVNGDTSAVIQGLSLSTVPANSHTGDYTITAGGTTDPDYSITLVNGTLTIGQAPLTITADNKSMRYGGTLPALTASYAGLVNGDTSAAIHGLALGTVPPNSHAGSYTVTASGAVDSDYAISYVPGSLTVMPAPLTIAADDKSKVYGAALPTLTASYSGLVNGDTAASLTSAPTLATTATAGSHVSGSPYSITASGAVDSDYAISYVPGSLTVTPATLTVQAKDASKLQGAPNPVFTDTITGFVNGDTSNAVRGAAALTTAATTTSPVGTYPINASAGTLTEADYNFAFQNGTLTVTSPFLVNDTVYTIGSGTISVSAAQDLLANDTGPSELSVTTGTVTGAQGGTFVFNADGSFTYTPATKFSGYDSAPFTVTDASGDTATHTVTVLSQHASVVWKFYESVLNRTPDSGGLQYWTNYLDNGGSTGDMAYGFFESDELLDKIITNYYEQYLDRDPDASGLAYWVAQWHAYGGPELIKAGFAASAEFYNKSASDVFDSSETDEDESPPNGTPTPDTWIDALYHKVLGRAPDSSGEQFWLAYYQQQTAAATPAGSVESAIALGFFDSAEAYADYITGWFNEYLGRNPTPSEQAQYVDQMQGGASDRTIEQEITNLPEYGNNPPPPPAGTAAPLASYYQTTAQSQAAVAAKDALFASL